MTETNIVEGVPIIDALPQEWRGTALLVLIMLPYVTRAYHSLRNGGGLVGVYRAILFGTNTPKQNEK